MIPIQKLLNFDDITDNFAECRKNRKFLLKLIICGYIIIKNS